MNKYECCGLNKQDFIQNAEAYTNGIQNTLVNNLAQPVKATSCQNLNKNSQPQFFECGLKFEKEIDRLTIYCGNITLIFCFLQMFGIWLAMKLKHNSDMAKHSLFSNSDRNYVDNYISNSDSFGRPLKQRK